MVCLRCILFFLSFIITSVSFGSACGVVEEPRLLKSSPYEYHFVWDVVDRGELFKPTYAWDEYLKPFKSWVQTFAPLNQMDLLRIQRKNYLDAGLNYMAKRDTLTLNGSLGKIEAPTCMEQYIFVMHISKFPQNKFPAEYMATILRSKANTNIWRIYFSFGEGRKFNVSPPPYPAEIHAQIGQDMTSGQWEAYSYVHSHPFMMKYEFKNSDGTYTPMPHVGGTVMASDEDITFYAAYLTQFGMKEASITTGLASIRYRPSDVKLLLSTLSY